MKTAGCIIVLAILAINLFIGAMAFGFCVETFTGKRPSRLLCMVGGAVTGEIAMPLAVILWILRECGAIHPPLLAEADKSVFVEVPARLMRVRVQLDDGDVLSAGSVLVDRNGVAYVESW